MALSSTNMSEPIYIELILEFDVYKRYGEEYTSEEYTRKKRWDEITRKNQEEAKKWMEELIKNHTN